MGKCEGEYVHWIKSVFGDCVSTSSEKAGFVLGLLSTIIWMYAQIPQIIMMFKTGNTDGLSYGFLCFLVIGDICNLVGAINNGGLITQIITSVWFIIVDGFCNIQYVYIKWIKPKCCSKKMLDDEIPNDTTYTDNSNSQLPIIPLLASTAASLMMQAKEKKYDNPYKGKMLYGTLLGWISTISYMTSRMPQIIKNCKRKQTDGLSSKFFISAVLGNSTYAISIFCKDFHWGYIWQQLPWIMGSAGMLFFDFTILAQFLAYRNNVNNNDSMYSTLNDNNQNI